MPRQTSIQLTPQTESQLDELKGAGFGTRTDIIRIAVDRMYNQEFSKEKMKMLTLTEKQAALAAKDVLAYAAINETTPEAAAEELGDDGYESGAQVLESYICHRFDSFSALSAAQRRADELEREGYQTLIEEGSGSNRLTVIGFKAR